MLTAFQQNIEDLSKHLFKITGPLNSVTVFLGTDGGAEAINTFYQALNSDIAGLDSISKRAHAQQILTSAGVMNILNNSVADVDGSNVHGALASDVTINGSQITGFVLNEDLIGIDGSKVINELTTATIPGSNIIGTIDASKIVGSLDNVSVNLENVLIENNDISSYITDNRGFQIASSTTADELIKVVDAKIGPLDTNYIKDAEGNLVGHDDEVVNIFTVSKLLQAIEEKLGYNEEVTYPLSDYVLSIGGGAGSSIDASLISNLENFIQPTNWQQQLTIREAKTFSMYNNPNCIDGLISSFNEVPINGNPIQNLYAAMQCEIALGNNAQAFYTDTRTKMDANIYMKSSDNPSACKQIVEYNVELAIAVQNCKAFIFDVFSDFISMSG